MEKPVIDPMFSAAPSPRPVAPSQPRQKTMHVRHRGNGQVDGIVSYNRFSGGLQKTAGLPAFDHVHSVLLKHRYIANGLMMSLSAAIAACALLAGWNSLYGYGAAALVSLLGLLIGLTSRFVFAGACLVLVVMAADLLFPRLPLLVPDQLATFVFALLGYGMFYLLCENRFSRHTVKDKITTPRGIKHNQVFQRALVRKYQKTALSGSPKP
jgi:hypothetical protein